MENLFAWKGPDGKNPEKERRDSVRAHLSHLQIRERIQAYNLGLETTERSKDNTLGYGGNEFFTLATQLAAYLQDIDRLLESSRDTKPEQIQRAHEAILEMDRILNENFVPIDFPYEQYGTRGETNAPQENPYELFGTASPEIEEMRARFEETRETLARRTEEYLAIVKLFEMYDPFERTKLSAAQKNLFDATKADYEAALAQHVDAYLRRKRAEDPNAPARSFDANGFEQDLRAQVTKVEEDLFFAKGLTEREREDSRLIQRARSQDKTRLAHIAAAVATLGLGAYTGHVQGSRPLVTEAAVQTAELRPRFAPVDAAPETELPVPGKAERVSKPTQPDPAPEPPGPRNASPAV